MNNSPTQANKERLPPEKAELTATNKPTPVQAHHGISAMFTSFLFCRGLRLNLSPSHLREGDKLTLAQQGRGEL
jgi:hypothetical protein